MRTVICGVALVAALAGVGCKGSSEQGPTNVAPIVSTFWSTPSSVASASPTEVTWRWTYANSPAPEPDCTIDGGVGPVADGGVTSVTLSADTTFTLSCTNAAGTDTAQTTITALGPVAPVIATFDATPTSVTSGSPTDVTWTWTYANSPDPAPTCSIDGVGAVTTGAVTSVTLNADTTFTLSCTNGGGTDTAGTTITTTLATGAPIIATFDATPPSVTSGSPTNVTWTWTYANSPEPAPTCTIDYGVGPVTTGAVMAMIVNADTTFTLSCTNDAGTDTARTTITTTAPVAPVIATFAATPSSVATGWPTDVTWTWTYANSPAPPPTCTIDNDVGPVTTGDVTSVTLNADTTFTLSCTNGGGTDTAQALVTATPAFARADFVSVVAGGAHTCGLTTAGVAYCWGSDGAGELGDGGGFVSSQIPTPVDVAPVAGNKAFVQLAAGESHSCGLTVEGVAYCWGHDGLGQLGNGAGGWSTSPSPVDTSVIGGNKAFVQVTAGAYHTCGLTVDGAAYCWGDDHSGALGNGRDAGDAQSPSAVVTSTIAGSRTFVELTAGRSHTCGRTADGAAHCWGSDAYGQLGNGYGWQDPESPGAVDTTTIWVGNKAFVQLSAGESHTCAIMADGAAYCWGHDWRGQLGDGNTSVDTESPSLVDVSAISGNKAFVRITTGFAFTCGIAADGTAYCWGEDVYGSLGDGGTAQSSQAPVAVDVAALSGNRAFVQLSAGGAHACGLSADGLPYCWGRDNRGQLGNGGDATDVQGPSAVWPVPRAGNRQFASLVTGSFHACGLTTGGRAYCWGSDYYGELGNGAAVTADQPLPSAVDASTITGNGAFKQLTTRGEFTCGLTAAGAAWCWGDDGWGKLGNGAASSANQPTPSPVDVSGIAGNKAFVQLSASRWHACGLTVEGVAYCWGYDSYGQLGNGAPLAIAYAPSPVDTSGIPGNKAFVALAAGNTHACGLTADGMAYCWGSDGSGGLGTSGAPTDSPVPVPVDTSGIPGDPRFLRLNAGSGWTCGITADGGAYCWGYDGEGELGNGAPGGTQTPTPIDVSALTGNPAFVEFAADWIHMCARTVEGVAYCWGSDMYGGLGNGAPTADQISPSPVDTSTLSGNTRFVQVSAGSLYSCGRVADGVAYCWGQDSSGQLGNGPGSTGDQASPTAVDTSGL
ncbi:MAG TPA: hypothetical protein VFL83_11665 [Anaeromyxobacter sp.]|nr:hypothetical protein [Anaeromyxobacter sp.]